MKNKKRILILGGTGFIGRNITNYFQKLKNYKVYATYYRSPIINFKNVTWIKTNLTDLKSVNKLFKNIDIVIQAAATTSGANIIINSPQHHVTDNAVMNSYIMRACHENNVKHVIFFSCTVMYPDSKISLNEKYKINPDKIFKKYFGVANTKIYIEKICEFYASLGSTKYTCIRHSNIYGQNDKFDEKNSHFFGSNIRKIISLNNNETLEVWGKSNEKRDMLHIDDLVSFVSIIIQKQKKPFELINCCLGKSYKIIDIIKLIIKLSNKRLKIFHNLNKPSIGINILVSNSKAKKQYNWRPKINIKNGILKTIQWYRKNYKS